MPARCALRGVRAAEGTVRDGGIRSRGPRGLARAAGGGSRGFPSWSRPPSSLPTWSASASSTSLGFQVKDIPSGFSILLLWTVGGIVALCGVFSYGELGAMFPRSSGEYNFLGRAYHPGLRLSRRLGVGDRWLRSACRACGDGVRRIREIGRPRSAADPARHRRGVAGLDRAIDRRRALLDLPADLDHPQGRADRRLPARRLRHRHAAADCLHAAAG